MLLSHFPPDPQPTPRRPPLAHTRPIRSPIPRKNRHSPAPPVPGPAHTHALHAPCRVPTTAQFPPPIRSNPATSTPVLKRPHIRAILAHVRDRPRGPETLPPKRSRSPGIRKGVPIGSPSAAKTRAVGPSALCPLLPRGATLMPRTAHSSITEFHRIAGSPSYETHKMSQNLTDFASPPSRDYRRWAPGNLKQAPRAPTLAHPFKLP